MEQNSTSPRLHALDGIRGIAIVLVMLNHINFNFIAPFLGPLLSEILFTSGVTGVSLLFILSGFFMSYIYPNPASNLHFLQKRYTRIFPLFLTMVVVRLTFWLEPHLLWYSQIAIIIFYAIISHIIWVYVVKKHASSSIRKSMFISFLILQIFVGGFYLFYIMRSPSFIFFNTFPFAFREGIIGLVNATLTLPLGDYVPMLDGVYWSLVAEVLFYILYPIICVPIIKFLSPQKRIYKILFIITLIPFFFGLTLMSYRLVVLSMIQIYICFYFVTGIILGYLYRNKINIFENLGNLFANKLYVLSLLLFLFFISFKTISFIYFPSFMGPLIHILWAFPITFIIAVALNHKTLLSKFLSTKLLVFLGTISYSIYLVHTSILHLVQDNNPSINFASNAYQVILIFILTIGISSITYILLEKPYFKRDFKKEDSSSFKVNNNFKFIRNPMLILVLIIILYFFGIVSAYQSRSHFNFFSTQSKFNKVNLLLPNNKLDKNEISMLINPEIKFEISANENNFEVLILHLIHKTKNKNIVNMKTNQKLIFKIKQVNENNWYAVNTYPIKNILDSKEYLFGFPTILDSKNKKYIVQLSMSNLSNSDYLIVDLYNNYGVYSVNKTKLLKHPLQLISFIESKIYYVVGNSEAELDIILFLPFAIFSIYLLLKRKK